MFLSPVKYAVPSAVHNNVQNIGPQTAVVQHAARPVSSVDTYASLDQPTAEEAAMFALINQDRIANGLSALEYDPMLTQIAREHSKDMCQRGYFDHRAPAPAPATPMDRYLATLGQRPDYAMVGENIYYRQRTDQPDQTQDQAETAFMNSPGHRANILGSRYQKAGVGVYRSASGEFWVTQMFLRDVQ
jgi:uncharacterized protein YkwD